MEEAIHELVIPEEPRNMVLIIIRSGEFNDRHILPQVVRWVFINLLSVITPPVSPLPLLFIFGRVQWCFAVFLYPLQTNPELSKTEGTRSQAALTRQQEHAFLLLPA